jgi:hypothetical protein
MYTHVTLCVTGCRLYIEKRATGGTPALFFFIRSFSRFHPATDCICVYVFFEGRRSWDLFSSVYTRIDSFLISAQLLLRVPLQYVPHQHCTLGYRHTYNNIDVQYLYTVHLDMITGAGITRTRDPPCFLNYYCRPKFFGPRLLRSKTDH